MSVKKRIHPSGEVSWRYVFTLPSNPGDKRQQAYHSGFATKKAAEDAEAARRIEENAKFEKRKRADGKPHVLGDLLREFLQTHAEKHLAPKTAERYRELAGYLSADLAALPIAEITPLLLYREWHRLLECGGHNRKGEARPMSSKTVRNVAGVVSAAFAKGRTWGIVTGNPVTDSDIPTWQKKPGIALTPDQQRLVFAAAHSTWGLAAFLEVAAATGARRGELLALRWSDIVDGEVWIDRSLSQTKSGLGVKGTKTGTGRRVSLPESARIALRGQETQQSAFREHFGSGYRTDLDLVFAQPNGDPLKPDSVSAAVSLLFRRLKLPKGASLHSLRHSHGSHLIASGTPVTDVQARLGHANAYTTLGIYSHSLPGRDEQTAQAWEKFQEKGKVQ